MKKPLTLFIATLLCMASAFAQGGQTGPLTWNLKDHTLTISGDGAMPDYYWGDPPWKPYKDSIRIVIMESGVTRIGLFAFGYCTNLTSITIPNTVLSIGQLALAECTSLTSITIPTGVIRIERSAFAGCTTLSTITIPKSVSSISVAAFYRCTSLTSIEVESGNYFYSSENGVLFNKDKTILICYPAGKVGDYSIPNYVKSIMENAFQFCTNLKLINIPYSVTSIGRGAFSLCENLKRIINLNPEPVNIETSVFIGMDQSACTLEVPMESVSAYTKAEVWKNFKIVGINVGVEEYGTGEVEVFPNPTTGELQVTSYKLQVMSIEVFDVYGRKLSHYSLLTTHYSINISHLPAGLYFVKVFTENGVFIEKVIKK